MGDPNDVNALQLLGAALLEDGDPAGATGPIEKALRLAPAHVGARVNLGCAQFALGLFDAAAKSFQEALTAKPDQPVAHLNLGNALFAAGRRSEAALAYRKAWDMNPAFGEALGGYVHCAAHTCAWDQAAAYELMDLVEDGASARPLSCTPWSTTRHCTSPPRAAMSRPKPGCWPSARDLMITIAFASPMSQAILNYRRWHT